ncbi:MAG: hypothetical protein AB7T06_15390 [Kofleriaceae bacterium]
MLDCVAFVDCDFDVALDCDAFGDCDFEVALDCDAFGDCDFDVALNGDAETQMTQRRDPGDGLRVTTRGASLSSVRRVASIEAQLDFRRGSGLTNGARNAFEASADVARPVADVIASPRMTAP